jgi:hypothetical protein
MFTIFQSLSVEIYRNLGVEIPPERIEPVIRSGELKIADEQDATPTVSLKP